MKLLSTIFILLFSSQLFANETTAFLKIYEGKKVEKISFNGNKTKQYIIERELQTKIGDSLNLQVVAEDIQRLKNLDVFATINVGGIETENGVEIVYDFKEIIAALPYVSYQISDENGLALGPAVRSGNFLYRDITLNAFFLFGGFTAYRVEFSWPWITGNHISFDMEASHIVRENQIDNYNEVIDNFLIKPGTYIGKDFRLFGEFEFLRLENEGIIDSSSKINKIAENSFRKVTLGNRVDNMPSLGVSFVQDTRDSFTNPNKGWFNEIKLQKTGGFLGGKTDFETYTFDFQKYIPITKGQRIQLATLSTLRRGEMGVDIPYNMDFHIGGANTVRGYEIASEDQLFGKNQFIGTFEYRYDVVKPQNISLFGLHYRIGGQLTAFADAGTVSNTFGNYFNEKWRIGYGIGFGILLPSVNTVRIEAAFNRDGEFNPTILISFYKTTAQRWRVR